MCWSWTQQTEENGEYKLFLAINISILFNNGGFEDTMNIKPPTSYSSKFYALRDIRKGEELLYDYDMYDTVWGKVGLGSEVYDDDDDDITTMMIVRRWRRQKMLSCNSRVENTMVHSRLSRNDLEKQRYWHSKKCKNKRNRL